MKPSVLVTLACLLAAQSGGVRAMEVSYSDVFSHYADSIARITTCGSWEKNEVSGRYRVIELYLFAQTFLYVDKVTANPGQTEFIVVKGFAIRELDDDHIDVELSGLRCVSTKDGIRISARADSGHDSFVKKIRIDVRASDDSYSVHGL